MKTLLTEGPVGLPFFLSVSKLNGHQQVATAHAAQSPLYPVNVSALVIRTLCQSPGPHKKRSSR